jgi:hypothetical protein
LARRMEAVIGSPRRMEAVIDLPRHKAVISSPRGGDHLPLRSSESVLLLRFLRSPHAPSPATRATAVGGGVQVVCVTSCLRGAG